MYSLEVFKYRYTFYFIHGITKCNKLTNSKLFFLIRSFSIFKEVRTKTRMIHPSFEMVKQNLENPLVGYRLKQLQKYNNKSEIGSRVCIPLRVLWGNIPYILALF